MSTRCDGSRWHRARTRLLVLSACALVLQACGTSFVAAPPPQPSAGLLVDNCPPPHLVPDEGAQTAEQLNVERVTVAAWGACYRGKFYSLKAWHERMAK